ncbi:MAG: tyrosine-type recombinase/integrase, partial [Hyphomonadaceae bacterium]|nr:tyrosine-type recombinase/integrase [Hyphomonadaceae bacterium]
MTVPQVRNAKTPGRLADGAGLYLAITQRAGEDGEPVLRRSWVFLYTAPGGKRREMGLGSAETVGLKEARDAAEAAHALLSAKKDPLEEKKADKAAATLAAKRALTFKEAAARFIEAQRAGWKNAKHAKLWAASLETHVYPELGSLAVAQITVEDVLRTLEGLWSEKPETASRLRGRIEAVLSWCAVRGYRDRNTINPAAWRGNLEKALPARSKVRKVQHHKALPYAEIPAFMARLEQQSGSGVLALRLAILTAARTGEVLGARWSEIDWKEGIWTIPAERMKATKAHRVALSRQALDVLEKARPLSKTWIFPGSGKTGHLSNMVMLKVLERMGEKGRITAHGFRSAFKDWASDCTPHARETIEAALAHAVGDKVEAAYRRSDALEKRRKLMDAWG